MIKKNNKRVMITFRGSDLVILDILMEYLDTKQVSKTIWYLLDLYKDHIKHLID